MQQIIPYEESEGMGDKGISANVERHHKSQPQKLLRVISSSKNNMPPISRLSQSISHFKVLEDTITRKECYITVIISIVS